MGYSPIGFVRCGRAACRVSALKWKMGKDWLRELDWPFCHAETWKDDVLWFRMVWDLFDLGAWSRLTMLGGELKLVVSSNKHGTQQEHLVPRGSFFSSSLAQAPSVCGRKVVT